MTVGLLGGAFDPPHVGHVELARAALDQFPLQRLIVLVSANPGHKGVEASVDARLAMTKAAFSGLPVVVERDDHSRTVDLLRGRRWNDDPLFLVGADEFADFLSWKEPEQVLRLARLGVATRPGYPGRRLERVLAGLSQPDRVEFFEIAPIDVSSTAIRLRVMNEEPVKGLVPEPVADLIESLDLYRR